MFKLTLKDSKGVELNEGDIVKVINHRKDAPVFYCEITFLEEEKKIVPFHNFAFSQIEKVDSFPEGAVPLREKRYKAYRMGTTDEKNLDGINADEYLMDWRRCEHRIDDGCFDIQRL